MNLARAAIDNKVVTLTLTAVMLLGGAVAYQNLARFEDPEFTIKQALVLTRYPGANAKEVEEQISDPLEKAIQKMSQIDLGRRGLESRSERGLSTITVRIKDKYQREELPQIWDELRRKVRDAQVQLPPGAGSSMVVDDFGDVWGIFLTIHGDEYSRAELRDFAKLLERELLLVEDVAKVQLHGEQREAIYVELSRDKISQLGIPEEQIVMLLRQKNMVVDAGRARVGGAFVALTPTGGTRTIAQLERILISRGKGAQIYLGDVAKVRRGYVDPPRTIIRFDGHEAIGLGISTISGGNVVTMGRAVRARLAELESKTPLGMRVSVVAFQSKEVSAAVNGFVINLLEAVAIVIVVLLVFMGLRSALIIGFTLVLTISGTFIFMAPWGIALERVSLGALVIALGMLVDNAIVIIDGMQVGIGRGEAPKETALKVVSQTSMPLLGATAVAIMAFGAIGLSPDSTGEICRSLFQVVLISLLLSWIAAVTLTPLLGVMFLRAKGPKSATAPEAYGGRFYQTYRTLLRAAIRYRVLTMAAILAIFVTALLGFRHVDQTFFPNSTRKQFMVDYWLPQGRHIKSTEADVARLERQVKELPGVRHVASMVGQGAMRFMLSYAPEKPNSSYAQLLVEVDDDRQIPRLQRQVEALVAKRFARANDSFTKAFTLGPGGGGRIQLRLLGDDANTLRALADEAVKLMQREGAVAPRLDWRQRVKVVQAKLAEQRANAVGITRPQVGQKLLSSFQGLTVGVFRERDELLPIVLRAPAAERHDIANIKNLQIWSPAARRQIPLGQVVSGFETVFEDELIIRTNRRRTLTVHCDPHHGETATALHGRLMRRVAQELKLPAGYTATWGGEYENANKARGGLARSLPFFLLAMVLIVVALFNSLREPAVIWLTVPLALIGVTAGLLLMGKPFNFVALLGFLSLSGMLIKNAIVLIDQIKVDRAAGKAPLTAVLDAGVSRLRPVAMAALTTALGMLPLFGDRFFASLAVTIVFGLMVATVLTMVVVPVLYTLFYRVPYEADSEAAGEKA